MSKNETMWKCEKCGLWRNSLLVGRWCGLDCEGPLARPIDPANIRPAKKHEESRPYSEVYPS